MKTLFFVLFIFPLTLVADHKPSFTDSLANVLKKGGLDANKRIEILNTLAGRVARNDNNRAKALSLQALAEAKKAKFVKGEAWAGLNLSNITMSLGDLDSSAIFINNALLVKGLDKDPALMGSCLVMRGSIYRRKQQLELAIKDFLKSIIYFEKADYEAGMADSYTSIALLYVGKKDYDPAITYHTKALKIRRELGMALEESMTLGNIGIVKTRQKRYAEALKYHQLSLKAIENLNDSSRVAYIYNDLGATYLAAKQPSLAISYLQKSIKMRTELDETVELAYTLNYLGEAFEQAGQTAKAIYYIKEANRLAINLKNTKQIAESYESISQFYSRNKQIDSAYAYSIKFINFKDSVEATDNLKAMDQLMVKYETEKKEHQIESLNQQATIDKLAINKQRMAILVIASLFILSGIFAFLLYNRNKLKQKARLQEQLLIQQDQLTKAVIEAEEHERKRIGSDLHDGIGQLFSTVKLNLNGLFGRIKIDQEADQFLIEKTLALVDESCKEIRHISHQMMPNMLLKSGIASDVKSFIEKIDSEALKVTFEAVGFKNKLEDNVEIVLYRVIQESVNNVIKHAKATELDIKLVRSANEIVATVKDNGIGFDVTTKDEVAGIGLKNIATRIEYLKGTVTYVSAPGQGTAVNITVPVR
ncbi:tetratricopeptide repeat protein [Mucilaginibacter calamicampi]|uniref:histidine kinase n=1 Tax=Mucilaginibacter calamicampi TaxID=1302352 RepID=A0ABW2YU25_9SPHI